jgi:hypothetical protein
MDDRTVRVALERQDTDPSGSSRVEMWRVPPLSSGGASMVPPWLRFHIPLIEPDRQISRTRLSLPAGAIAGWGLHPLESAAFAQRTPIPDIALRNIHKVGPLTLVSG